MPPIDPVAATRRLMFFTRLAASALVLAGLSVLAGWAFDLAVLKSLMAGTVTMKANTALAFVLAGTALWLHSRAPGQAMDNEGEFAARLAAQACAAVVVAIGLLTLAQYLLGWDLGLDQLLFTDSARAVGTFHPGRMAPNTALCFVLGGGVLLVLGARGGQRPRARLAAKIAAGLLTAIAAVGLLGYLAGVPQGYSWWSSNHMAIATATLFTVLGAGLTALAWRLAPVRWEISRRTTVAFSASLLLMLVLLGVVFRLVGRMESTSRQVGYSQAVQFHVSELYASVLKLETGQRGFILTGAEAFLEPYHQALRLVPTELAMLRGVFADNPGQRERLQSVEYVIAERMAFAVDNIATYRQQGHEAAAAMIKTGRGKAQMDEIRRLLGEMAQAEILVTDIRTTEAEKAVDAAFLMLPVGGLLSIGLLLGGLLLMSREISTRRVTEQLLRLQSGALDAAANAIIITDRAGAIESVNQAFTTLSGYTRAEVLGKNPRELIRSDQQGAAFYRTMWETILAGRVWRGELLNRRKDGSVYSEEMTITPMHDESGLITHFIAVKQDITERTQAEGQVRAREEEFRLLAEAMPQIVWVTRPDGWNIFFNQQWMDYTGLTLEESLGHGWNKPFHPEDQQRAWAAWQHATTTIGIYSLECRLRRADGIYMWWLIRGVPVKDASGAILKWFGTCTDIHELKMADEALREQAALLDKARDAIVVRDLDERITYWNKSAERLYGWTAEEAIGRDFGELLYPTNRAAFEQIKATLLSQGEWMGEVLQTGKDGRELMVEVRLTLVRGDAGQPVSVLMIISDISERKKIEAQFLRAQRVESIGMLAGGIAHDLNNVLAPIMMSIELLKRTVPGKSEQRILETIETSARRGAAMVKQVLSFARGVEGHHIPTPPKHLIGEIASVMAETFPKSISCETDVPPDAWLILGDPTQLHQVLLNLCVNARDAMPDGGRISITVENKIIDDHYAKMCHASHTGPYVLITVADTGTGIPAAVREKIFDPFFTTKENGKGTGLGLSTAATIIKAHGGFIQVYSEPGQGTTFKLGFPAETVAGKAPPAFVAPDLLPGSGELILVVDDEAAVRVIAQQTLAAFGYRVLLAGNGAEARAQYAQRGAEIALVLTDLMMPVMDGVALSETLLAGNPSMRIIATSGLNDSANLARAVRVGVKDFLPKPYTAETLLVKLRQVLPRAA